MSLHLVLLHDDTTTTPLPHSALVLDSLEVIDELAAQAELLGISDYADTREVPDDFDGDLEALNAALGPIETWHEPHAAADNLEQLAAALGEGAASELSAALNEISQVVRTTERAFVLDIIEE